MKKIYCDKLNSNDDSYTVELINVDSEFAVSDNDLIFEFETSKANIDIHAEFSGFIYHNLNIGSEVKPGELLYIISLQLQTPKQLSQLEGNYSLIVPEGVYKIQVSAPSYKSFFMVKDATGNVGWKESYWQVASMVTAKEGNATDLGVAVLEKNEIEDWMLYDMLCTRLKQA